MYINGKFKCDACGRFCKVDNLFFMTPWGSTLDLDEPEEEHRCTKCLSPDDAAKDRERQMYWRGPSQREPFLLKDKRIYGPHIDVEALTSISESTDERPD